MNNFALDENCLARYQNSEEKKSSTESITSFDRLVAEQDHSVAHDFSLMSQLYSGSWHAEP